MRNHGQCEGKLLYNSFSIIQLQTFCTEHLIPLESVPIQNTHSSVSDKEKKQTGTRPARTGSSKESRKGTSTSNCSPIIRITSAVTGSETSASASRYATARARTANRRPPRHCSRAGYTCGPPSFSTGPFRFPTASSYRNPEKRVRRAGTGRRAVRRTGPCGILHDGPSVRHRPTDLGGGYRTARRALGL